MEIKQGNILLTPLTLDKIEMIRQWRNDASLNQFLHTKVKITPKEQVKWFEKISQSNDIYLMIQFNNEIVGLIYTKSFGNDSKGLETNILIGNKELHDSGVALKACLLFTNYLFKNQTFDYLYSKVHKENSNALKIDQFLGFVIYDEDESYIYSKLDESNFLSSKGNSLLTKITKPSQP